MKNVAIIPARSGSKGVPGKNIKLLGGTPLIAYTIEAAMLAGKAEFKYQSDPDVPASLDEKQVSFKHLFDSVVVTSDDDTILALAKRYMDMYTSDGSPLPITYRRHKKLSMDHVQTDEVLLDTLRELELTGQQVTNVCLLQPTSPFRNYQHVYESWLMYQNAKTNPMKNANCLVSCVKVAESLDGYHWYGNDMMPKMIQPMGHNPTFRMGRQWEDPLPTKLYRENGAIYWFDADQFSLRRFYRMAPFAVYEMDEESSLDINTMEDWETAESIVSRWWGAK